MSYDKEVTIELIRSLPAWIALGITLIAPLINKKIDIEKDKVNFLFSKRYDVFTKHFNKLYEFRSALTNLIAVLMCCRNEPEKDFVDILNENIKEAYVKWEEVSLNEASLWLFAEYEQLNNKNNLLLSVQQFFHKLKSLQENETLQLSEQDIIELAKAGEDIQVPITHILQYYRNTINLKKVTLKDKILNLFKRF